MGKYVHRPTTRPLIEGTFGVVTATHYLGSTVAMQILERGGNAVDAACAAGFALQVAEPNLCGPAGELSMLLYSRAEHKVIALDGHGPAPRGATLEAFRNLGLRMIPGTGLLPATVPGAFDGWLLALEHYGTLSLEEVLAPAVSLAEQGVMLLPNIRALIRGLRWLFTEEWPTSGAVYLPGGRPPEPGRPFRNPDMARTFRGLIREEREHRHKGRAIGLRAARKAFYQGFVAEAIDAFCRQADIFDMTGERHRAFLAGEDLAAFEATFDTPVSLAYHGHTVHKCGPWSQGPVFLQQLRLLSGFDLPSLGHNTADYIHVMIEAAKLAFADRDVYYGDPGHSQVPLDILLSEPYAAERRGLIDAGRASQEFRPGRIAGFAPNMEFLELARQAAEGRFPPGDPVDEGNWQAYLDEEVAPLGESGGDTVHVDVIDKDGNMVAVTPSGGWFPSSPVVPGLGFPLGTRGQMFWLIDNHPAALAPGRKPRTTLSPSMVTRGDEPYMAFGTPGADQQDQWPLHLLLSHIHFGLDLQQAIEVPGFHSRHFPASFAPRPYAQGAMNVEDRLAPEVVPELERRGHLVNRLPPWVWEAGRELAASIDPDAGVLRAAASPRGYSSYAIGR